jgi:hypothetical protein
MTSDPLRVANCSGFFGDRLSAAKEMVNGGPIDVLTGDYLAELTMAILMRQRMKDPAAGYARTFLLQMEEVLATCIERGIKVVANAGGLNPNGLAGALQELATRLGVSVRVGTVTGDDLMPRIGELGDVLTNQATGERLTERGLSLVTANAYLGGWGIAAALARGADVVVTGRVADAALVVGPAAWRFGWERDDWDSLAGAVVAGHVIECGAQATGGNYSFFAEVPGIIRPGFPIAEIHADGSSVITKHPGTGGLVSVGTVTAHCPTALRNRFTPLSHPRRGCSDRHGGASPGRLGSGGDPRRRGRGAAAHHQGCRHGPRRLPQLLHVRTHRTRRRGQGGDRRVGVVG